MRAFSGVSLLLIICISHLHALDENGGGEAVAAVAASPTTIATTTGSIPASMKPAPSTKTLAAITRGISRLEVKLEKLTNRIERLREMDRLKKIMRKMDSKKSKGKAIKARRGASAAAAAGKRGTSVAVSASRRAGTGTGASGSKKRKQPRKPATTQRPIKKKQPKRKPAKRAPKKQRPKKKQQVPMVDFHKNKRGGTSVAVSAGSASAGAAAGGK